MLSTLDRNADVNTLHLVEMSILAISVVSASFVRNACIYEIINSINTSYITYTIYAYAESGNTELNISRFYLLDDIVCI